MNSSLDHVIKATVMLTDMSEWPEMNKVYVTYFAKHLPARSALGANGLALGARVEIECIAVLKYRKSASKWTPGPDAIVYLGKTPGGYDVEINRLVAESDLTIYVNAEHNLGFSGGWKSVCVGLSTYRSIRHHHTPDGMSMSIKNNRMHKMLDEMGELVESKIKGKIFKVDTILANPLEVAAIFAGSVWETRKKVLAMLAIMNTPRHNAKFSGQYVSHASEYAPLFFQRLREVTEDAAFWRPKA